MGFEQHSTIQDEMIFDDDDIIIAVKMGLTEERKYQGQKFRNLASLQFITSKNSFEGSDQIEHSPFEL